MALRLRKKSFVKIPKIEVYTDDTILTWGKYKFTRLKNIPASWLVSKHNNNGIHDRVLVQWVADNLERLKERAEQEIGKKFHKVIAPPPVCDKYQYASEEQAKKHLREIHNKGKNSEGHVLPIRAYKCNECPFWHLTSKEFGNFAE